MKSRRSAIIALGAAVAAFGGYAVSGSANGASTSTARTSASSCTANIGDVGPYTGTVAALGDEQLDFAKLAIQRFNAQYGTHLTLVEGDDQFVPAQSVTVVQSFISNSKIVATEGPATTASVEATGALLTRAGLAAIAPSATQEDLIQGSHKFPTIFSVVSSGWAEGPTVGGYMVNKLHAKRVFIVDDESSFAVIFAKSVAAYLAKAKIPSTRTEVSPSQTDFTSLISTIPAGTDYVFLAFGTASEGQVFGKQLKEQGRHITVFGDNGLFSPSEFTINGSYVESFAPDLRQIPADASILKEYEKEYNDTFATYGGPSYAAAWVLASAVYNVCKSGQTPTRANVLAQVRKTNEPTSILGRPISFDKDGELKNPRRWVFHIVNGKFVQVY